MPANTAIHWLQLAPTESPTGHRGLGRWFGRTIAPRARVEGGLLARGRVFLTTTLDVPCSVDRLWRMASDLPRFLTIDPFHARVTLMRPSPAVGVHLALAHRVLGLEIMRFGKLLRWREGQGYAFSDLSSRGPNVGFPHVFFVDVTPSPTDPASSRLTIQVKGKWTARWLPAPLIQLWLRTVCHLHARLLRVALSKEP